MRIDNIASLIAKVSLARNMGLIDRVGAVFVRDRDGRSCGRLIIGIGSNIYYKLNYSGSVEADDVCSSFTADPFQDLRILVEIAARHHMYLPVIGYLSYESLIYSEPSLKDKIPRSEGPLAEFFIPKVLIEYDSCIDILRIIYDDSARSMFDRLMMFLSAIDRVDYSVDAEYIGESHSKRDFISMIRKAKERIVDGEVFQIVLSRFKLYRVKGSVSGLIYRIASIIDQLMYFHYIDIGYQAIIGASPETLIRGYRTFVETYPIAGTRRRIPNREGAIYRKLVADPKERAEHMMLVDLARNDLGKIAVEGTVKVERLMYPQILPNVIHIVSKVVGRVGSSGLLFEAFRHLFPAGTVTGAPKPRPMYLIGLFEQRSREAYAGAVGYARKDYIDFAITIRSAVVRDSVLRLQAGAGIVYDSRPELEYIETENKMGILERYIAGSGGVL
jgi:anthranilate synthase component 1